MYAAFLYGVNIPKGKQLTLLGVRSALEALQPALAFARMVGRPDSLLLRSTSPRTEDSVRRAVSEALDCPCVIISTETLERVVDSALDTLRALGSPAAPPYRVTLKGAEWEWCLAVQPDEERRGPLKGRVKRKMTPCPGQELRLACPGPTLPTPQRLIR